MCKAAQNQEIGKRKEGRKGGKGEGQLLEMTRNESQEVWLLDASPY